MSKNGMRAIHLGGRMMLALSATVFGVLALVVVPLYAVFMVTWMHAPLFFVFMTTVPVALVLGLMSWLSGRAAARKSQAPG